MFTVLHALGFLALVCGCVARECQPDFKAQPTIPICLPKWSENRTSSLATDNPVADVLNARGRRAVDALQIILNHFESEAGRLLELRSHGMRSRFEFPRERPCNVLGTRAAEAGFAANLTSMVYGFGVMPTFCPKLEEKCSACISDLDEPKRSVKRVSDAMRTFEQELGKAAGAAVRAASLAWKDPRPYMNFTFRLNTDVCRVWHSVGFRVRGRWGVNVGLTNANPVLFLDDRKRLYLVEVLRVNDNKAVPIAMNVRKDPFDETSFVRNTTSVFHAWGGVPSLSMFESNNKLEDNPALRAVLDMGSALLEQIQLSVSAGGISVLITPIVLTLVPLAAVSHVSTKRLIVYTIGTDMLTTLPLLIKGVEMVSYGTRKHETIRSRIYGGLRPSELAIMETWYASCEANSYITVLGHVFIGIAIVFMVIGVGFEFYAQRRFKAKELLRTIGEEEASAFDAALHSQPCSNQSALNNKMAVFRCERYEQA